MTDITELAQRARINAECGEHLSPAETLELVEALESEKRICATWRKTAKSTGEKLEKAQQVDEELCKLLPPGVEYMDPPDGGDVTPLEGVRRMVADYRQRIAELEEAEQQLCAANVTLDARAELAERQLAELESSTVTVENLQESAYRAGLTAGWNLGLANNNDGFNKCLAAHTAGIKVEAE